MYKIITPKLAIELTQKCNLDCSHCLNGEHNDLVISKEIVEKLFDEIKYVDILYFTGGEVFLAYEQMKMVLDIAKQKDVKINHCSMLTNGTIYDERIYKLLNDYFKDNFAIGISNDDYHDKSIKRVFKDNIKVAQENMEKHYFDSHSTGFKKAETILFNTGRAKNLQVIKTEYEAIGYYYGYYKKFLLTGPIIFIGADGYITEGNLEIAARENQCLGNILDETLVNMIINGGIYVNSNDLLEFFEMMDQRCTDFQYQRGDHWRFLNHKMVPYQPSSLTNYYNELENINKLMIEIISSETTEEVMKKILSADFSSYPHDISQGEH